jgi:hypothetical protein
MLLLYFLPSLRSAVHIYLFLCRQTVNNQQLLRRCIRTFHATHSHAVTNVELFLTQISWFYFHLEHERVMDTRYFISDFLYELGPSNTSTYSAFKAFITSSLSWLCSVLCLTGRPTSNLCHKDDWNCLYLGVIAWISTPQMGLRWVASVSKLIV